MSEQSRPLGLQNRLYEQAVRLARLGAWECDLVTEELTWTDGVYDLFDLPLGSRPRRAATLKFYVDESRAAVEAARAEAIRSGQGFTLDARIRTRRGESRWMRLSADVAYQEGRPVRIFGAKQDITAEKEAWVRLRQAADRDPLTGLANRAVFDAHYRQVIGDPLNHASVAALVLVDLDHFKQINDRLGHLAGDECLREVGLRLHRFFKDAVLVARIGGDEFAVLLRAPLTSARIAKTLQRASSALSKPILWNGRCLELGVSIGASVLGRPHGRKMSEFFAEADTALYAAKAAGRNTVRLFRSEAQHASPIHEPTSRGSTQA